MGGHKQKKKIKINLNWATHESYVFSNHSVPARNMRKTDLGSVIFGCKNSTIKECLSNQLFGLPEGHYSYVRNISKGLVLFLFNYSNRTLHGIYEATTPGQMNIDKYAWVKDGDDTGYTNYPAQVRICVKQECKPLSEKQFGPVIADNYYESKHFYFELDHDQTNQLVSLFRLNRVKEEIYPQNPTRLNNVNQSGENQIVRGIPFYPKSGENDFLMSSRSRDRSRSPGLAKRFCRDRASYRDALCKKDKPACRQNYLLKRCKRPGHFARDCPNATVCNKCGLPGHLALDCTSTTMCRSYKESGRLSSECPNDPVCNMCGKIGHLPCDCHNPNVSTYDARLCNDCYKPGHLAAECTNEKTCNKCRKTGHIACECSIDPVCNIFSMYGHVARQCPKSGMSGLAKSRHLSFLGSFGSSRDDPFWDMVCRNCGRLGHISCDCLPMSMSMIICDNCGGRGHREIECPSAWRFNSFDRAFPDPCFHRY